MLINVQGQWWLPGLENKSVHGVLTFSQQDGGQLELDGAFRTWWDSVEWGSTTLDGKTAGVVSMQSMKKAGTYPRILGKSDLEGKIYTLLDCASQLHGAKNSLASASESIIVNQFFEGILFDDPNEEVKFEGSIVSIANLTTWLGLSGFSRHMYPNDQEPEIIEITTTRRLKAESIVLANQSTIRFEQRITRTGDNLNNVSIEQALTPWSEFPELVTPKQAISTASLIQDLVSIAALRPCPFESVKLLHPESLQRTINGEARGGRKPVAYFARWRVEDSKKDRSTLQVHDLVFNFVDIGQMTGVASWVNTAQDNLTALNRVMTVIYGQDMFIQDKLMNCLAALDYVGKKIKQPGQSDNYGSKLQRCAALAGPQFEFLVGDVERWKILAKAYRNDLAHHTDIMFRNSTFEINPMVQSSFWLFILCLFRLANFPDAVFDTINQDQHFLWVRSEVQEIL